MEMHRQVARAIRRIARRSDLTVWVHGLLIAVLAMWCGSARAGPPKDPGGAPARAHVRSRPPSAGRSNTAPAIADPRQARQLAGPRMIRQASHEDNDDVPHGEPIRPAEALPLTSSDDQIDPLQD